MRRLNIVKISVLPKSIYRFNPVPIIILAGLKNKPNKQNKLKSWLWNVFGNAKDLNNNTVLKKNSIIILILLDSKIYYEGIVINMVWSWHRTVEWNRKFWNRSKTYLSNFQQRCSIIQCGKESLFNRLFWSTQMSVWKRWVSIPTFHDIQTLIQGWS